MTKCSVDKTSKLTIFNSFISLKEREREEERNVRKKACVSERKKRVRERDEEREMQEKSM